MILQIPNSNTIDSLSFVASSNNNNVLTLLFGIFIVVVIYFIYKSRNQRSDKKIKSTPVSPPQAHRKESEVLIEKRNSGYQQGLEQIEIQEEPGTIIDKIEQSKELTEVVEPEGEEQSGKKYIGYIPNNIFAQSEPLDYPYVIMPKPNSVIKFPRKGRSGRKGYKEEEFKAYIDNYFRINCQIFDDRFVLVSNNQYEPDITLIDEKEGINIFLDIEIDEPYEGLNDIAKRKPTHYQYLDTNRNNLFKNRGWIIIRFAEIQVHKEPVACCRYIADVLKSINPKYSIPSNLLQSWKVTLVKQWTKEQAKRWSNEKYREKYLGISKFGTTENGKLLDAEETELGSEIEEQVEDDEFITVESKSGLSNTKLDMIQTAINSHKYLSFNWNGEKTIVRPLRATESDLTAFCYVKNKERAISINDINDVQVKDKYYTKKVAGPTIGLEQIKTVVNSAIDHHKLVRIKYTRSAWSNILVDQETGELILDKIEAEESIRTINNIQLSINVLSPEHLQHYKLDGNYITAYCNKREEQRTFRFDRIGEVEILDI